MTSNPRATRDGASARWSLIASLVAFVLVALAFASALAVGDPASVIAAAFVAAFPVVALVITRRQPRNGVAWCFIASAVLLGIEKIGEELAPFGLRHHWPGPVTQGLAWAQAWAWFPGLFLLITVALLRFPTGTLPSPRWRWVERASLGAMGLWVVCLGIVGLVVPARELLSSATPHPHGWYAAVFAVAEALFGVIAACALASLASLVLRYRRSSVVEREQIRWVLFAASTAIALEIALDLWGSFVSSTTDWAQTLGEGIGFAFIAIATGVAITRYKLYEIDRIVSRTVTYLVVLAVLVLLYVGLVIGLADLVPTGHGQLGVAAATLAVSIVAVPLTRRVRGRVDRRFNRARFDSERVVAAFAARLRARPERDDIPAELVHALERTMQPAHAGIWLVPR